MSDQLLGRTLGDYKLESRLTSGGMAHIYMGIDERLGRRAAVKILTPDMGSNDETLTGRFEREARAIAQLEHDNIVTIYQFGTEQDLYFLAMRYVEGNDLADELKKLNKAGKLMDVHRALFILEQVASALDYAHSRGIIHRDVKPSNVLLGENDKAVLTDFGLVLWKSADNTTGTAFGTPRYISPEQATDSASVVPQSDIYSLGVMMYELLAGAPPFTGTTPMEVALAHLTETPVPPRALNGTIPADAQLEILKAMNKQPEQRHSSAVEFVQAVQRAYEGEKKAEEEVGEAAASTIAFRDATEDSVPEILKNWQSRKTLVDEPGTKPELVSAIGEKAEAEKKAETPEKKKTAPVPLTKTTTGTTKAVTSTGKTTTGTAKVVTPPPKKRRLSSRRQMMMAVLLLFVIGAGLFSVVNERPATTLPENGSTATQDDGNPPDSPTENGETGNPTDEPDEDAPTAIPLTRVALSDATVRLRYRDDVFAFTNISDSALDISDLQLIGETDNEFEIFINDGGLGTTLEPGECVLVKNRDGRNMDVPEFWNCDSAREATQRRWLFWRADTTTDTTFSVQYGTDVQTVCETTGRAVRRLDGTECLVDWQELAG